MTKSNYKISIKIEIEETNEKKNNSPILDENGNFKMIVSEDDAISIDKIENSVLRTNWPAIREAISKHLSEISKKKALELGPKGELIENEILFSVDGEVGRFNFKTYKIIVDGETAFNCIGSLYPVLRGKEIYKTTGFKEIGMIYGDTQQSFRATCNLINRLRYQVENGTPFRTLQDNTEKEGVKLQGYISAKSKQIMEKNKITPDGLYIGEDDLYQDSQQDALPKEKIVNAVYEVTERINERMEDKVDVQDILGNQIRYEEPKSTVKISVDDVNVKKQKDEREEETKGKKEKKEYVHNTIAHIEKGNGKYTLNGYGMKNVLNFAIALLFNSNLIGLSFLFFTDGHTTLNEMILKHFSWYKKIGIILDWYHLVKKFKEQLSLAMKGREMRNAVLKKIMPYLWIGMVDMAIKILEEIKDDESKIKDQGKIEKLVEYLNRNRPCIPCYAVRKALGLRNSSSIGEKMNDLIVSKRQKHNGMSWSKSGSVALASITALKRNGENRKWFEEGELEFKIAA